MPCHARDLALAKPVRLEGQTSGAPRPPIIACVQPGQYRAHATCHSGSGPIIAIRAEIIGRNSKSKPFRAKRADSNGCSLKFGLARYRVNHGRNKCADAACWCGFPRPVPGCEAGAFFNAMSDQHPQNCPALLAGDLCQTCGINAKERCIFGGGASETTRQYAG